MGNAYAKFAKDIKGASLTDPSCASRRPSADLDSADVKAASQKISDYFNNHCQG